MRHVLQKSLISIGFASVSFAAFGFLGSKSAAAVPTRKCPFEARTIQQVVEESRLKSSEKDQLISQASTTQPTVDSTTTTSPEASVERVREVYRQICSRTTQAQPQVVQPAPVEQPAQSVEQPVEQPAEERTPVRALW